MRLGLKTKETLAVTLLTFLVVATTSLMHFSQLTRVTVLEAVRRGELIAQQIYAQTRRTLAHSRSRAPWEVLRNDPELRSLLDASVGYSPDLVYASLADETGKVMLHSERSREGTEAPERPSLGALLAMNPIRRFLTLSEGEGLYEVTLPLRLDDRPFGSIRLGIATSLLRREVNASLRRGLAVAGLALPVAWLVAMGLANLTLKPLRRLSLEMARLRRGEFEIGADIGHGDEFKELASELRLLGQQLHSDRLKSLSERTHLQQVVDQLEDGLIFFNQDRRILFFNKAAEAVLQRAVGEVIGRPLEEVLEASHPLRPLLERALVHNAEFRNAPITIAQDAKPKEFLVSAFTVVDARRAVGTMVLLKDLDSIKTLQSLVSYSAKLTALGRLTSGVAHEVKNPLNAMMIHLELLKERLGVASEGVLENLEVIGSEIRRLDRAVQGFLKFIRPQELALGRVNLNALLQGVITLLEAEGQKAGVLFVFRPDARLPLVTADQQLLHQAFLNILLNACQAMPRGGTITVATAQETGDVVRVSVADQGVGIPKEDLEKIFELYYTTKPDGSGLGLSLVYRIVQLHDGHVDVSSEVGRGTTMSVRLPVG